MSEHSASLDKDFLIRKENTWDWVTPICLLVLSIMSVVFIHSAQAYGGAIIGKCRLYGVLLDFLSTGRYRLSITSYG